MSGQRKWSDIGGEIEEEPELRTGPFVWADANDKPVGKIAYSPDRDGDCFVKQVKRGNPPTNPIHYYVKGSGYAISVDVIDNLDDIGIERVFVHEKDTGNVLEWELSDFKQQVKTGIYDDEQLYATESDMKYKWPNLNEELYSWEWRPRE